MPHSGTTANYMNIWISPLWSNHLFDMLLSMDASKWTQANTLKCLFCKFPHKWRKISVSKSGNVIPWTSRTKRVGISGMPIFLLVFWGHTFYGRYFKISDINMPHVINVWYLSINGLKYQYVDIIIIFIKIIWYSDEKGI